MNVDRLINVIRKLFKKQTFKRVKRPNAMIVVENLKKRIFRYIPEKYIPSNSFEQEYEGKWLHILGLDMEGKFWPIERPKPAEGRMPTDLYMAKHCADEVEEVYGLSMSFTEKIKIGVLVGLCFGILIVIFMMAAAAGGG